MLEKLKSLVQNDQIFLIILVCLVGLLSFGLGRWSVGPMTNQTAAVITISDTPSESRPQSIPSPVQMTGQGSPALTTSPAETGW